MPSILPGFEYDIFISYRHNDNRSGWVTEFVKSLQEELASTIKDPVSVYFDTNPHDGLLETHDVDDSLKEKLKCIIFIPIISQTYCDPKSFAWRNEFLVFKNQANGDQFGLKVKLQNGNITSRILPVKIHELDAEDRTTIENEIGGVLRAIEFIYKETGVNRPLKPTDSKTDNKNKTDYRNQVNKVANAIKEIIQAMKSPPGKSSVNLVHESPSGMGGKKNFSKKVVWITLGLTILFALIYAVSQYVGSPQEETKALHKSIAVLSFTDMSPNHDQEYFGDGLADEIINALTKIKELKVIGRTSSFQFKGEKVDLRDVGAKLQVATVLEGSVMKSGNRIRVTAQLINVEDGTHIWSERYNREITDVFSIQDEIATAIANKLALSLDIKSIRPLTVPTANMEAYEFTLKGNHFLREGPYGAEKAMELFQKALALDSNYSEALLGYTEALLFKGRSDEFLESIHRLESLNAYPVEVSNAKLAYYLWRIGDWKRSAQLYDSARTAGFPPDITAAYFEAAIRNNLEGAISTLKNIVERDPLFLDGLRNLVMFQLYSGEPQSAHTVIDKIIELNPDHKEAYRWKAEAYRQEEKFVEALEECSKAEVRFNDSEYFLTTRILVLAGQGKLEQAKRLFLEVKDVWNSYNAIEMHFSLGMEDKVFEFVENIRNNPTAVIYFKLGSFQHKDDPRFKRLVASLNLPD